jgi:hypothetical protein
MRDIGVWCAAGASSRDTDSEYCSYRVAALYSADFVVLLVHGPFVGEVYLNAARYLFVCLFVTNPPSPQRLRWSMASVLPLSTQVRGFTPGRSRQDF